MNSKISKCKDEKIIWKIVHTCAIWLSQKGMDHWIKYYTAQRIKNKTKTTAVYTITIGTKTIGTISISKNPPDYYDAPIFESYKEAKAQAKYISMLAILPKYHNRGFGSHLMHFAENLAHKEGAKYIRLDVVKEDKELNIFYKKKGYLLTYADEEMHYYEKKL